MSEVFNVSAKLWHAVLVELGFTAAGDSQIYSHPGSSVARLGQVSEYQPDAIVFDVKAGWGALRAEWRPQPQELLHEQLGQPGLWKTRVDGIAYEVQPIFEVPPTILAVADPRSQGEEGAWLMRDTLAWGLATAGGKPATDWELPARHLVDACLPQEHLTVQVGHVLRQISVVYEPDHLALSCTLLPRLPGDLPPGRSRWLEELLLEGHNRWKLVRIGVAPDDVVLAEVDLTGVPASVLDPLLRTGLEALRYAVGGLVQAADFLADGSVPCRALEVHTPRA